MKKKPREIDLGFVPHKHQVEFFMNWKRYNELICTRRFGKSVIAAMALTASAMKLMQSGRKKQPKFAYIAPQKDQAKQITWPIFKEFLAPLIQEGMVTINNQALEVFFHRPTDGKPWAQIKLYAEEKDGAESIRGNYLDGCVFDEYDSMDADNVWKRIVRPALGDTNGWVLFAGTIDGKANLYNLYKKRHEDPRWNIGIYKFEDTWQDLPAYCNLVDGIWVPDQEKYDDVIDEYRDSPEEYGREYQCDWNCDGVDALIPNRYLSDSLGKHLRKEVYDHEVKIMGIDVSGDGPDSHTIAYRQGLGCSPIEEFSSITERELTGVVMNRINKFNPDMVFVDHTGGYGTELISRLRQQGVQIVRGVNFGSRATDAEHYTNKRTEMYHRLRDWIIDGGALPDDDKLEQELSVLSAPELTTGKAQLIKKDDIRELIGRSPDRADALALTFAETVYNRRKTYNKNKIMTVASSGYDPFNDNRNNSYGIF